MFHMLTCFNLKNGVTMPDFKSEYMDFVAYMQSIGLVEKTSPIGQRDSDTIMDSDSERDHEFFVTMSFRDRAQVDAAVELLATHKGKSETKHRSVYSKVRDQIFICWKDMN